MSPASCEHAPSTTPPEGITLRVMKASDLPHVRALHRNLLPVSYPAAFFIQLLVNARRLCLVAVEGGAVVGFASAAIGLLQPSLVGSGRAQDAIQAHSASPPDIPRTHVTLLTLGVLPAYQRRGIGRSLVHGVIQRLEASCGATASQPFHHTALDHISDQDGKTAVLVQVQVAPSNSAGKRFYAHLGMMDQRLPDDPRFHLGPVSQASVMVGVLCV